VRRYIKLFEQTGEVQSVQVSHGPKPLLGEFEQLALLELILRHPGIYLKEIQNKLESTFGVTISVATICRTLKRMGCTRQAMHHVAMQRSDMLRAKFMADVSIYDPNNLVWVDETGCDRRNTVRKYGYSTRGMPISTSTFLFEAPVTLPYL
jgi:transposase